MNIKQTIESYISKADWRVSENANSAHSAAGLQQHLAGTAFAEYMLNNVYPAHIAQAHRDCKIHIHDLSFPGGYCAGWDLQQLLLKGFGGVHSKQEAGPPKHLRSALGQLINFIYTMSGEWAGAIAVSNFDTLLAPFIRYDGLNYSEVYQAIQEFIFNVNVPNRLGMQSPFSNITLDLVCPEHFRDQPVIIGGEFLNDAYGEFEQEVEMLNRAFCEVMTAGDVKGRVFTFPIPTYNITKDFDWQNRECLWEMTAKYGLPYFGNYVNSDMQPSDALSMCCRLRLDKRELNRRAGGLFAATPLTGSVGVVTLNMPHLAYLANGYADIFLGLVESACDLAKEALEIKREWVESMHKIGMYPYSQAYLEDSRNGGYLTNHFSTIGLNGMHEAALNLYSLGIESKAGLRFAQITLDTMRAKLLVFQKETGNLYNLEATPAEGTCYRFAKHDKARWPDIITAGTDAAPYYTNSTQLPVGTDWDIMGVVQHQDQLQPLYTGGTVHHIYLGEFIDAAGAKLLIKTIIEKTRLPYVSLTPTFSICPEHKHIQGEHFTCPECGKECEVYSRVVGYLRPVQKFNKGKQQEYSERKQY